MFPIDEFHKIQANPENFRMLQRVPMTFGEHSYPVVIDVKVGDEVSVIVLDTETTGLDADSCKIIELGAIKIQYSPSTNTITEITSVFSALEDPNEPLSDDITRITGITDEQLIGHQFNNPDIEQFFSGDPIICAHNSSFDRPFFENRFPFLTDLRWVCSAKGVNWSALGFESFKLEYLLLKQGYFYEGHRATIDCFATLWLLYLLPGALKALMDTSTTDNAIVRAMKAPFDVKDALKARGYKWNDGVNGRPKHWSIELIDTNHPNELLFLEGLYKNAAISAVVEIKTSRVRFKKQ